MEMNLKNNVGHPVVIGRNVFGKTLFQKHLAFLALLSNLKSDRPKNKQQGAT